MNQDIRAVPAFGKRSSEEVWARAQDESRELAICPLRFSAFLTASVALGFALLLDAVRLLGGATDGVLGTAGALAFWITGETGLMAGLLVLIPAALLAQCAFALLSLGLSGQPLVIVDAAGIVVLCRTGGAVMAWEEVSRIRLSSGFAQLERNPRAVPRMCTGPAFGKQRVWVPTLLISGGAEALTQEIAAIRPDIARRLIG